MKTEISFFEMEVKHSWGKELEDLEYKSFIGNEFDKMGIKHSWEEEQKISRLIGYLGGSGSGLLSGKGHRPSDQGKPVFVEFITQQCSGCGAVRERLKVESWSNFWDSDIMNLLACPLQSSNVKYEEKKICYDGEGYKRHCYKSNIDLTFRHGNIEYELFYNPIDSWQNPIYSLDDLIHVGITVPTMESSANYGN
jgi:hypothetical protein